jgi:hypothetical protein
VSFAVISIARPFAGAGAAAELAVVPEAALADVAGAVALDLPQPVRTSTVTMAVPRISRGFVFIIEVPKYLHTARGALMHIKGACFFVVITTRPAAR